MMEKDTYRPEMADQNATRAILIITDDKVEDLEFFYPYYRFIEAGYRVDVATPGGGAFKGKQGLGLKDSLKVNDIRPDNYTLLYLPGGKAPAKLRKNEDVIDIVRAFAAAQKPIAAVCHGPQILAAADVIRGRKIAAWPEVKDEVVEAGAEYVDQETVVHGQFITARWPGDLPSHMKHTLQVLKQVEESGRGRSYAAA